MHAFLNVLQAGKKIVTIDGYQSVSESNERRLKMKVAEQPVATTIEAYGRAFQLYGEVRICLFNFYFTIFNYMGGWVWFLTTNL